MVEVSHDKDCIKRNRARSNARSALAHTRPRRYGKDTVGTFRAELRHVFADDDGRVAAMHRNIGTRVGKTLDVDEPRRYSTNRRRNWVGGDFAKSAYPLPVRAGELAAGVANRRRLFIRKRDGLWHH